MNKSILIVLLLFLGFLTSAQNVQGVVKDENGNLLSGASVYFDGSTLGVITDEKGKFKIDKPNAKYAKLVVSYLGYETIIFSNPKSTIFYKIILQESNQQLEEVLVQSLPFTRKEMIELFRVEFLGETRAGRRAKILNEDDIYFKYDFETHTLSAYSYEPLQVSNPYLGYNITFDLVEFYAEFNMKILSRDFLKKSFFGGTSHFEDISEGKKRMKRRRKKAYKGSSLHFFRALANENLKDENFSIFHKGFVIQQQDVFDVEKKDDVFEVQVLENDLAKFEIFTSNNNSKFRKQISVLYQKKRSQQTEIVFTTNSFFVDHQGNYNNIYDIMFIGEMSKAKIGEMLPLNYRLE